MGAFDNLYKINVNEHVEKKVQGGTQLSYLSWTYAWAEIMKNHPDATYEVWKDENNRPYVYDPLTGYMVYTKVTIEGVTREMWLPVMDGTNHAMKAEPYQVKTKYKEFTVPAASMMDINKAIMRCLVKNLAMFGLGLYIYAGEDLPETEEEPKKQETLKDRVDKVQSSKIDKDKVTALKKMIGENGMTAKFICDTYKVKKIDDLTERQHSHIVNNIERLKVMFDGVKGKVS